METKEYQGKITWLSDINQRNGQENIGLRIDNFDGFFNIYKTKEELENIKSELKKGYEIKFIADRNMITTMDIISTEIEKKSDFGEDLISFEELLEEGHKQGLKSIISEVISCDFEKRQGLVKVIIETDKGHFEAHGDATSENCKSSVIIPHFLRMAETRALARALRFATNISKTAREEIQ